MAGSWAQQQRALVELCPPAPLSVLQLQCSPLSSAQPVLCLPKAPGMGTEMVKRDLGCSRSVCVALGVIFGKAVVLNKVSRQKVSQTGLKRLCWRLQRLSLCGCGQCQKAEQ